MLGAILRAVPVKIYQVCYPGDHLAGCLTWGSGAH